MCIEYMVLVIIPKLKACNICTLYPSILYPTFIPHFIYLSILYMGCFSNQSDKQVSPFTSENDLYQRGWNHQFWLRYSEQGFLIHSWYCQLLCKIVWRHLKNRYNFPNIHQFHSLLYIWRTWVNLQLSNQMYI